MAIQLSTDIIAARCGLDALNEWSRAGLHSVPERASIASMRSPGYIVLFTRILSALALSTGLLRVLAGDATEKDGTIEIQTDYLRYLIGTNGINQGFIDRVRGVDYLDRRSISSCASLRARATNYPALGVSLEGSRLRIQFGSNLPNATLKLTGRGSFTVLTLETVSSTNFEGLTFLNVPLRLRGQPDEPFGACTFSLNLQTRVDALPALQTEMRATCFPKFGIVGAKAALIGAPTSEILPVLKQVLTEADEMPHCPVAGPWAQEIPFNHGSYLFNFGTLTETNVDEWVSMARSLGVTQIDNHGGSSFFRFGDFQLNSGKWPDGWTSYQRIVRRLHDEGIGSIFHTYAFFIDKQSKYVSPIPDKRLDAFRTFTLAAPIAGDSRELAVRESTRGLSTVTGFFEHNSVTLQIDDELITFNSVPQEAPWRFGSLKRGAYGTRPAEHLAGAKIRHLKECFGLFVPDVDSSLFAEIARNHAEIVNACGFDGIYLDAIDGSSILRGAEECWFWADKFVFEIQKHLQKPVGMEMSSMWHHFWQFRTRWQAWDYPQRGQKRFLDLHAQAVNGGLMLPLHLGWWNFQSFDPPQTEPSYPDVIEDLGAKLVGWDAGISLTGAIDAKRLKNVPLFGRAVEILRRCEELRRSGQVPAEVRAQLREPGREFALVNSPDGALHFRPSHSDAHLVNAAEPWSLSWTSDNPFPDQSFNFRLEALMSTSAYDDPSNLILMDPADPRSIADGSRAAQGIRATLKSSDLPGTTNRDVIFEALNSGNTPRTAAWARLDSKLSPVRNLHDYRALGISIEGDGQGELLGFRLESPPHISFGAVADRYVPIDFDGRRICSLVETESSRWSDYSWEDGKSAYNLYRETIDFGQVSSLSIWLNNVPPGKPIQCRIGPVKALRMLPGTVRRPRIILNGETVALPVDMPSGSFLEILDSSQYLLSDANGDLLAKGNLGWPLPKLRNGKNAFEFQFDAGAGPTPRARVVIFSAGTSL